MQACLVCLSVLVRVLLKQNIPPHGAETAHGHPGTRSTSGERALGTMVEMLYSFISTDTMRATTHISRARIRIAAEQIEAITRITGHAVPLRLEQTVVHDRSRLHNVKSQNCPRRS